MHKQSHFSHLPEAFTQSDLQGHFRHLPLRRMTQSNIEPHGRVLSTLPSPLMCNPVADFIASIPCCHCPSLRHCSASLFQKFPCSSIFVLSPSLSPPLTGVWDCGARRSDVSLGNAENSQSTHHDTGVQDLLSLWASSLTHHKYPQVKKGLNLLIYALGSDEKWMQLNCPRILEMVTESFETQQT